MVVANEAAIRESVINHQRPDLTAITEAEPETLATHAVGWISRCWNQSKDERPTFAGICCAIYCFIGTITFYTSVAITYSIQHQLVLTFEEFYIFAFLYFLSVCRRI